MKYACLVYLDAENYSAVPDDECMAYGKDIAESGHRIGGEALQPIDTATAVRVRNGQLTVTDGPFAETKELLAGFYLIEARDLNEAIRVASRIPPARVGTIEVRPIRELQVSAKAANESAVDRSVIDRDETSHTKTTEDMRVMVIVKASEETERGVMPTEQELREMGNYNKALVDAGIMEAGEGLHPTTRGVRVRFDGPERTVTDGPFPETKELIAGYWIWNVESIDEAVMWLEKAPFDGGAELEIRQIFEEDDFGDAFTPELREQEQRMRERISTV